MRASRPSTWGSNPKNFKRVDGTRKREYVGGDLHSPIKVANPYAVDTRSHTKDDRLGISRLPAGAPRRC